MTASTDRRQIPGTHVCPGGCGTHGIPNRYYACPACWSRLPRHLQRDVQRTVRSIPGVSCIAVPVVVVVLRLRAAEHRDDGLRCHHTAEPLACSMHVLPPYG